MAFTFKVKKRCRFCGTVLREDGTCPNQKCPRYVPDPAPAPTETPATSESVTDTNVGGKTEAEPTP